MIVKVLLIVDVKSEMDVFINIILSVIVKWINCSVTMQAIEIYVYDEIYIKSFFCIENYVTLVISHVWTEKLVSRRKYCLFVDVIRAGKVEKRDEKHIGKVSVCFLNGDGDARELSAKLLDTVESFSRWNT